MQSHSGDFTPQSHLGDFTPIIKLYLQQLAVGRGISYNTSPDRSSVLQVNLCPNIKHLRISLLFHQMQRILTQPDTAHSFFSSGRALLSHKTSRPQQHYTYRRINSLLNPLLGVRQDVGYFCCERGEGHGQEGRTGGSQLQEAMPKFVPFSLSVPHL